MDRMILRDPDLAKTLEKDAFHPDVVNMRPPALVPQTDPELIKKLSKEGIPLVNPQKAIAGRIRDNEHLRNFLQAVEPVHRLKIYEALVEHLSFKAKPFWWLMSKKKRRQHAS